MILTIWWFDHCRSGRITRLAHTGLVLSTHTELISQPNRQRWWGIPTHKLWWGIPTHKPSFSELTLVFQVIFVYDTYHKVV